MGYAIASIALGLAVIASSPRIVRWMGAADEEPLVRENWRMLPAWMTRARFNRLRAIWVWVVGLVLVGMGVAALV